MPQPIRFAAILRRDTSGLTRRQTLTYAGYSLPLLALPAVGVGRAMAGEQLKPTPRQSRGPFYPTQFPSDVDNDLLLFADHSRPALGQVTYLSGKAMDTNGTPLGGLQVEIWQCDTKGHYHHSRDRGTGDEGFQGYGRTTTDAEGSYRFRTIKPVPYPGRTPHIHVAVSGPGIEPLTTQIYVRDEPLNARDGLFRRLPDDAAREALLADFVPAPELESEALKAQFDIIIKTTV